MEYSIFPEDVLRDIFLFKSPCELKMFLDGNSEYKYIFENKHNLKQLAKDYGLPYYNGINLDTLCSYEKFDKRTLIYLAAEHGDSNAIKFLLQSHKQPSGRYEKEVYEKAITKAASHSRIKILKILFDMGECHFKPAMIAVICNSNNPKVLKYIIDYIRCNFSNDVKKELNRALKHAAFYGNNYIMEFVINEGADNFNKSMEYATIGGRIDTINLLLKYGATNSLDEIMKVASNRGHIDLVKRMIELGANNYNNSLLTAAFKGCLDIVKILVKAGATNINNSLINAVSGGHYEIIKFLLEFGADNYDEAMYYNLREDLIDLIKSYKYKYL